jgi:hypothetical protein
VVIFLARNNQNYLWVCHISKWFLGSQSSGIPIPYPVCHLGSSKDLYKENYRPLKKEIEDIQGLKGLPCLWIS